MALRAPRGTADQLPAAADALDGIIDSARTVFGLYGYERIETPVFEQLDVFVRGIGEATDVVGKEMFHACAQDVLRALAEAGPLEPDGNLDGFLTANLKAEKRMALRPEGTAGIARAAVEHNLVPPGGAAVKLWYHGSMFRRERPQKGRLREFHQIGAECLGASEPSADAEVIIMLMHFFQSLGLPPDAMRLYINSMGDDACRPAYRDSVRDFILAHSGELCGECNRRADTNPLRAFDCKNPACQEVMAAAPHITDALCPDCREHYDAVRTLLDASGLPYEQDPRLVRGLDYYTRTVFEVQVSTGLGSQNAIGGGGRYDKLIEQYGGKPTCGLGFAVGLERIQLAREALGVYKAASHAPDVYVAAVSEAERATAFSLALRLREAGVATELDHQARSLKSQFKHADKTGAPLCLIVGPEELAAGKVRLRAMDSHEESVIQISNIVEAVRKSIR